MYTDGSTETETLDSDELVAATSSGTTCVFRPGLSQQNMQWI
jgi:hypothetical protein